MSSNGLHHKLTASRDRFVAVETSKGLLFYTYLPLFSPSDMSKGDPNHGKSLPIIVARWLNCLFQRNWGLIQCRYVTERGQGRERERGRSERLGVGVSQSDSFLREIRKNRTIFLAFLSSIDTSLFNNCLALGESQVPSLRLTCVARIQSLLAEMPS